MQCNFITFAQIVMEWYKLLWYGTVFLGLISRMFSKMGSVPFNLVRLMCENRIRKKLCMIYLNNIESRFDGVQ